MLLVTRSVLDFAPVTAVERDGDASCKSTILVLSAGSSGEAVARRQVHIGIRVVLGSQKSVKFFWFSHRSTLTGVQHDAGF